MLVVAEEMAKLDEVGVSMRAMCMHDRFSMVVAWRYPCFHSVLACSGENPFFSIALTTLSKESTEALMAGGAAASDKWGLQAQR